ncbi:MAG: PAS domain S-box protein, partial [Verrucomicrobiota bacterium]
MKDSNSEEKLAAITRALHESRERFQVIFDSINEGIAIIDPASGKALEVNKCSCEMFGYTLDEFQRMNIVDVSSGVAPYTQEAAMSWIAKAMKGPVGVEWQARSKSGRLFWVDVNLRALVIGTQELLLLTVRDIDEHKRMEISLQESEYWLKESQRISHMGSYVFDIQNNRWTSSPNLDAMFGIKPDYSKTLESWSKLIHPDDRERMILYFSGIMERRESFLAEYRIIRLSDGVERHVQGQGDLVFDENGRPVKMFGIIHDITEQKLAEEARDESELRYHSLFKNMNEGVAYSQGFFENGELIDYNFLEVNDVFVALTGLHDATGKNVSEVIPGIRESNPELFKIYGRVALTGIPEKFEAEVIPLKAWFSISVYSPRKEYFVAVFDNITERKTAEKTLRQLSLATEQSPASVVITNPCGEIEYVNRKFELVTGYTREEVIGKNPRVLKSGALPKEIYENL